MTREPFTWWFENADGRCVGTEILPEHSLATDCGIVIGRDPSCDVVLPDPAVEAFHARYCAMGHHRVIDVIAGEVDVGSDDHPSIVTAGEISRCGDELRIAGWRKGARHLAPHPEPELLHALSIADDARLEGRHAYEVAVLATIGYTRVTATPRTALPERLAAAEQCLWIRVASGGATVVHVLGARSRLASGVTIGRDPNADLVVPAAGDAVARLVATDRLTVHVLRGVVERRSAPSSFDLGYACKRFALGAATIQLCRWPADNEPLV